MTGNAFIGEIATDADAADAARLMQGFLDWCRARYAARPWHVEGYFDPAEWAVELADLRTVYAPPDGAVLLARVDGVPAGCVAYRTIGDRICEMKRLFVGKPFQGIGLGRLLCQALIDLARARGFHAMRLETGDLQPEAHALYRGLGFRDIAPYTNLPARIRPHMLFMERAL